MNEIQGAIGQVQLARLDYVLAEQRRKTREKSKRPLPGSPGSNFATFPIPDGDGGDTLAFFLPDAKAARAFNDLLAKAKIDTKILPSAMNWHFAGNWAHMIQSLPPYRTDAWPKSETLLKRAIALPISVRMSEEQKAG